MRNQATPERSYIRGRDIAARQVQMTGQDVADVAALADIGLYLSPQHITRMAAYAMDDTQSLVSQASIGVPVQFLQEWLPGFVAVMTAARKADELMGILTAGSWEDEEVVQGLKEPIGLAVPYGDYSNVPLSSYNTNFVRRTIVRYEQGMKIGSLEEARASRIRISAAAEKRMSAALALEIQRNLTAFNGFNSGNNLTYGFLNDPGLPAYVTVAATGTGSSTLWSTKSFLALTADIRTAAAALQNQSQDTINPEDTETTLAVATSVYQYLTVVSDFGISVRKWISDTYPKMRIVSAPQLNAANSSANVFYLYADAVGEDGSSDGGRTWVQVVPAKFQTLGVEKQAKAYVEDYTNATAGAMLKRPYAVVRYTGI